MTLAMVKHLLSIFDWLMGNKNKDIIEDLSRNLPYLIKSLLKTSHILENISKLPNGEIVQATASRQNIIIEIN